MTLEKFLLNETLARELCLITSCGYVEQTVFIDHEDLFIHAVKDKEKQVRGWHFGTLLVYSEGGKRTPVPCRFIEIGA